MRKSFITAGAAMAAVVAAATSVVAGDGRPILARANLQLADGTEIGDVRFLNRGGATEVRVRLGVPVGATAVRSFHGFHVHANDNPANGDGCLADPAAAASTWFVSADGHFGHDGELHGNHAGDMPSLHLNADGTATTTFSIDRIELGELAGRVVILHAGPDNFGNVPVGTAPNQYAANSQEALDRTAATGNAGDRIACAEIAVR